MQHRKNYRTLDISGNRYGRLVADHKVEGMRTQWLFKCDCGNEVVLHVSKVFYGQQSCGCMRKEVAQKWGESHITHGASKTKLYRKYRAILDRCYDSSSWKYKRYGGRGIYVCDEWKNSFESFRKWAYENGYDPNKDGRTEQSLDRIDNSGPYSPENCRWATAKDQSLNRDITKTYPYKGEQLTASEFAERYNITDKSFVYRRVKKYGMSLEEVLYAWNMINKTPEGFMKANEYAKKCGVANGTVDKWIKAGKLKAIRVGKFYFINTKGENTDETL